jgi:hypothetical protein
MRCILVILTCILLQFSGFSQANTVVVTKYQFGLGFSEQNKEVVIKYIKKMVGLKYAFFNNKHDFLFTEQVLSNSQIDGKASMKNIHREYQHFVTAYTQETIAEMHKFDLNKEDIIIIKK